MTVEPKRRIVVHVTTEIIVEEWPDEDLSEGDILDDAISGIWEGDIIHTEIVGER